MTIDLLPVFILLLQLRKKTRFNPVDLIRDKFPNSVAPDVEIFPSGIMNVTMGAIFQVVCRTKGVPYPQIRWEHNGQRVILPNTESRYYTVKVTRYDMAGLIECIAENGVGTKSVGLSLVVNCE